uniref:Uncharacterized protein n=1 Tax=Aegilops tauschii subsp. strangulata TaxID=200361 RepID=A0A453DGI4_AEGTS
MTKTEKVGVKSRDACVVGSLFFYFLMRPTSYSLHWREKINVYASITFCYGAYVSICHHCTCPEFHF